MLQFINIINFISLFLAVVLGVIAIGDEDPSLLLILQFYTGCYQLLVSLILVFVRRLTNKKMDIHLLVSVIYLLMLITFGYWWNESIPFLIFLPWGIAVWFTYAFSLLKKPKRRTSIF